VERRCPGDEPRLGSRTPSPGSLPPTDRPAGRSALLTALASYQVGPSVIEEFRIGRPADGALTELTAWASLAAARRVGSWTWDTLRSRPEFSAGA
jgi:hypothetical protein